MARKIDRLFLEKKHRLSRRLRKRPTLRDRCGRSRGKRSDPVEIAGGAVPDGNPGSTEIDQIAQLPLEPGTEKNLIEQQEAAAYILEMTLVLRNIANDSGLEFLSYLLDMAAEEAEGRQLPENSDARTGLKIQNSR